MDLPRLTQVRRFLEALWERNVERGEGPWIWVARLGGLLVGGDCAERREKVYRCARSHVRAGRVAENTQDNPLIAAFAKLRGDLQDCKGLETVVDTLSDQEMLIEVLIEAYRHNNI